MVSLKILTQNFNTKITFRKLTNEHYRKKVTVGEVCEGYFNDAEEGVEGYNGLRDIRPRYQGANLFTKMPSVMK